MSLFTSLKLMLTGGSQRTIKAKKNIIQMIVMKGISVIISFIMIPLTIEYIDDNRYGIWLTMSSMVAWLSFFDIGLNLGLKNKLTTSIAEYKYELARKYVSTTYVTLCLIFIPLSVILLILVSNIDLVKLLNLPIAYRKDILWSAYVLIVYFCLQFILSTINIVVASDQRPSLSSLCSLLQQLASLIVIAVMINTTEGSLLKLSIALCIFPLLIILIYNLFLFRKDYKNLRPSFRYVDFSLTRNLMKQGSQFFIIQIAGIIQWQMANFLIIRSFGASAVTEYNIAFKYFNALYIVWGILTTPLWSAVTDAITKSDFQWVRNALSKYSKFFMLFVAMGMIMFLVSPYIYKLWLGDEIYISLGLSFGLLVYTLAIMFSNLYVSILNGAGVLKTQMLACTISPILYLLIFYACKYFQLGIYSVIIASVLANFNGLILAPIQCYKLLTPAKNENII